MIINITWDKYIEVQSYLLANLDKLIFKMGNNKTIDVIFKTEEDAVIFKLKYSL